MPDLRDVDEATLIEACELFFGGAGVGPVQTFVNERLAAREIDLQIKRPEVYQLIKIAKRRKLFVVVPPRAKLYQDRIADRYRLPADSVHVVNMDSLNHVASAAADVVIGLIGKMQRKKDHLRIGLGGGWTSMLLARDLATRLRGLVNPPAITLHALSSGFDVSRPQTAPVSFFGYFANLGMDVDYVGLFATAVADTKDYPRIRRQPGVRESFEMKDDLDLVFTGLGSASHSQGDFSKFMAHGKKGGVRALERAGWIGDVQYRPYSATGPIKVDPGIRAVTLLELDDLRRMASDEQPDKHVVIVAGPCAICGSPRSDAVLPLLDEPKLKFWTHLVMDQGTAGHLLPSDGGVRVSPPRPPSDSVCDRGSTS
jgi:DNA-binding transcriptional regulator LsrR (DeoR family)